MVSALENLQKDYKSHILCDIHKMFQNRLLHEIKAYSALVKVSSYKFLKRSEYLVDNNILKLNLL